MKQPGKMIIWPACIDSAKSRREGRRVAKAHCIQSPRLEELEEAAKRLALEPTVIPETARPSRWWERSGYMVVEISGRSRSELLKGISRETLRLRAESRPAASR